MPWVAGPDPAPLRGGVALTPEEGAVALDALLLAASEGLLAPGGVALAAKLAALSDDHASRMRPCPCGLAMQLHEPWEPEDPWRCPGCDGRFPEDGARERATA